MRFCVSLDYNHLGCYVNNCFAGAFAYADDLLLLSSSLCKLQLMLDLCCIVGSSYDLSFNPSKCLCGVFGTRNIKVAASLSVSDTALKWCDKMTYLGITFIFGRDLSVDITNRLQKFHAAVCAILKIRCWV
jgi:hypothetical protein